MLEIGNNLAKLLADVVGIGACVVIVVAYCYFIFREPTRVDTR